MKSYVPSVDYPGPLSALMHIPALMLHTGEVASLSFVMLLLFMDGVFFATLRTTIP